MLLPEKIADTTESVGPKARRLAELTAAGFAVPPFVVVTASEVADLQVDLDIKTNPRWQAVGTEIAAALPAKRYAVRSAALVEDGKEQSFAGQYQTELAVRPAQLVAALAAVIQAALTKGVAATAFSVIVQEYLEPDYAGVCFSRNPLGGREVVVEYVRGNGATAVGGAAVSRLVFLPNELEVHQKQLGFLSALTKQVRRVEQIYDWPQDVEWAVKGDQLYLLQTRPVTSLGAKQWQSIKYLDHRLEGVGEFFYEQTAIAETFSRPRPLAFSMLERLYQAGGPIDQTYCNLGVRYQATNQFKLLGNQVYVDKEAEVKALYPALGYLAARSQTPKLCSVVGLGTTVRNFWRLTYLSDRGYDPLQQQVCALLQITLDETSGLKERWQLFTKHYTTLFEVGLRAQKATTKLRQVLGRDQHYLAPLLIAEVEATSRIDAAIDKEQWVGNSLAIDDVSPFRMGQSSKSSNDATFTKWWTGLPAWKRHGWQSYIKRAQRYQQLREEARWVGVRLMSYVRRAVLAEDKLVGVKPEMRHFATLDELLGSTSDLETCQSRQATYQAAGELSLPSAVASFTLSQPTGSIGLAPGIATGVLVGAADLTKATTEPKILYTKILSPELTQYFDQIAGIVTEQGGLLSHLAIVAREAGLPVVQSVQPLTGGQIVTIDGGTGKISVRHTN